MNSKRQRSNWLLDVLLFGGFVLAMLLDVTGLAVHQWLGIAVAVVAGYHLARHWKWVKTVGARFFGRTTARARWSYVVDAALLAGLFAIAFTGLVISSWFRLNLANYEAWRTVHVLLSVATLVLIVVKIGMHWRWIVSTTRRVLAPPPAAPAAVGQLEPVPVRVGRRDFLGLMAGVGVVSLVAGSRALMGDAAAAPGMDAGFLPAGTGPGPAPAASAPTISQNNSGTSCTVACGRRCSYPGRCGRYRDSNGNGRCDLGECVSNGNSAGSANENSGGSTNGGGGFRGQTRPPRGRRG